MEDHNIPSAERIALLERLQEAIGNVPLHFWAACQTCDINALENLVNCGRKYPTILRDFALQTITMAHYWGPYHARAQSLSATPKKLTPKKPTPVKASPSTPLNKSQKLESSLAEKNRSQRARDLAEERDNSRCVLTREGVVEIAYIYPFHSLKYQEKDELGTRYIFWDHLKNFWPQQKIAAWEAELFPAGIYEPGAEVVYNLITLSKAAHELWGRGAFALKPIFQSDDKTKLEVQFHWQRRQQETQSAISLLTLPFSTEGLDENIGVLKHRISAWLITKDKNNGEFRPIQSGDRFTLHTDDPETKPLPSFALLELQWFLQRIQGMAGAAEVHWPSLSESGSECSDDVLGLDLDEV